MVRVKKKEAAVVVEHEFDRVESTDKLLDEAKVPVEAKAVLAPLPPDETPEAMRQRLTESASRELRHRAHVYHGVTRAEPPKGQHEVDVAASALYRAAIKFTHAYDPAGAKIDPSAPHKGCACIYCA